MAPEQAMGRADQVDARTDEYALAVVTYVIRSPRPSRTLALPGSNGRPMAFDFDVSGALSGRIDKARVALEVSAITEAVAHAEAACELAARVNDPVTVAHMRVSESLLERAFLARLGSLRQRVVPAWIGSSQHLSSRTMFLLSRLDGGVAVEDALDVASMPRLEALRRLVQLARCGALRLE